MGTSAVPAGGAGRRVPAAGTEVDDPIIELLRQYQSPSESDTTDEELEIADQVRALLG